MIVRKIKYIPVNVYNNIKETFIKMVISECVEIIFK